MVLPLALHKLSAPELQVWQLLASVLGFQMLLDIGLSPTFSRLFARAAHKDADSNAFGATDWEKVGAIWRTMHWLYRWSMLGSWLLLAPIGTLALWTAMGHLENPMQGWLAWAIVALTAPLIFPTLAYSSYLQGLNQIPLLRRWEAFTAIGSILSNFLVLLFGGKIVALIVSTQIWTIFALWRNWHLCRYVSEGRAKQFGRARLEPEIWQEAWPAAWRSGVGIMMTSGFVQATGFIYSQFGKPAEVAAYLIALRYLTAITQFSTAPFYSKLPILARLQALGRIPELLALAQRGMRWSHWTFAAGVISAGWLLPFFLKMTGSHVAFVSPVLWWLLATAMLAERYGAMHLQLYSTTNRIVWHIANGVSGLIMFAAVFVLLKPLGIYAFPVSMLAGYLGFYVWYSVSLSCHEFNIQLWQFERRSFFPMGIVIIMAVIIQLLLPR